MTNIISDKFPKPGSHGDDDEDLDADAILAELEEEGQISSLQSERLNQLKSSATSGGTKTSTFQREIFQTLASDDETLRFTTEYEKAVVHFFHPEFARCDIMDDHLRVISQRHADARLVSEEAEVRFGRVNVKNVGFVVERLGIKVLPCVIGFVQGVAKGRVIGFEGICWDGKEKDVRVSRALEERMVDWGIWKRKLLGKREDDDDISDEDDEAGSADRRGDFLKGGARKAIQDRKQQVTDEDDDWD